MKDLPASIAERLQVLAYEDRAVAWLQIDLALTLIGAGGHLAAYGLDGLHLGVHAVEAVPFLVGLLPLRQSPEMIPSIELGGGRAADLHLHRDGDTTWAILLDVTPERNRAQRMQQKAYDMTLAQEREAQLNRQLAAANAALTKTQRELEASRDALVAAHAEVRAQATELARWNKTLEERVAAQLAEIDRVSRLKRFLAPALVDLIVSSGDERILQSHRRDIAALFCDLRGFTAFAESAEPEEVMELLHGYHATLVPLIQSYEGTLDRFVGDGMMVLFNDPLPCPNPAERAVRLAVAMREAAGGLSAGWRRRGYDVGFGVGIAQGFATLGQIGFEGRIDYSAVGTVVNTAARLSDAAKDGQILVTSRVATAVAEVADLVDIGSLAVKGLSRPLAVANVVALKLDEERQVIFLNRQTR
ncbi:MAG TPA: adenylate/guanylate cyclase domain-containing protein [Stellaceae bacterium]|nr:adenylate/guanylate cyclase domain-containing protein [Stellaceae bacterium]